MTGVELVMAAVVAVGGLSGVAAFIRMLRFDPAQLRAADRAEKRDMLERIDELHHEVNSYRRRETDLMRRVALLEDEVARLERQLGLR